MESRTHGKSVKMLKIFIPSQGMTDFPKLQKKFLENFSVGSLRPKI
jgi:hypothetical protein